MFSTLVGMAMPYITSAIGLGKNYLGKGWGLMKDGGSWLGDNLVGVGALTGGLAGIGSAFFGSKSSAKRQYKYQSMLQKQAYDLQKQGYLEFPSAQRQGLEAAGYNPMLALGGLGSASYSGSGSAGMAVPDIAGSARVGSQLVKDLAGFAKAQIDNIKADTKLKKGQLSAVESQRLQTEANTSLLHSQTDRADLAYGIDIVNALAGVAGTGASAYSAAALGRLLKKQGDSEPPKNPIGFGVPAVDSSAKGSHPNASAHVGSSAKSAGRIAKEIAKEIVFGSVLPLTLVGATSAAVDHALGDDSFYKRVHNKSKELHKKAISNTPRRILLH